MRGARPLERREVRALLRAAHGPYEVRDRCLLQLALNTGLRVGNLTRLTVGQVSHAGRPRCYLQLPAAEMKSRKGHVIPLNTPARNCIAEMLTWKRARGEACTAASPLFRSRKGGFLTPRHAGQIVTDAAERAGLEPGVSTHSLRKTLATSLMERGVSLRVVQEILGHAKLETTAAYLGAGRRSIQKALEAAGT